MPGPPRRIAALISALLVTGCGDGSKRADAAAADPCAGSVAPLSSGFGARGLREPILESFANPGFPGRKVTVALPLGADRRHPVVLIAHANDVSDAGAYRALLEHVASRGYAAVLPDYMQPSDLLELRYDVIWAGLEAALARYAARLDRTRLGLVGHSFGGGSLPWVSQRAADAGLGERGLFLMALAPWFALRMDEPESWAALPPQLKALVLVFEEDRVNDHRIAIDLYERLPVPGSEKEYLAVRSDRSPDCPLPAVHTVPQSTGLRARDDALDERAVFRLFDALAAYAFEGDEAGRRVALGKGRPEQVSLGTRRDGRALAPLEWNPQPRPLNDPAQTLFDREDAAGWKAYPGRP